MENIITLLEATDGSHAKSYKRSAPAARKSPRQLAEDAFQRYIGAMSGLTKQEQLVLGVILGLVLTGLLVKYYRVTHPAATPMVQTAKP